MTIERRLRALERRYGPPLRNVITARLEAYCAREAELTIPEWRAYVAETVAAAGEHPTEAAHIAPLAASVGLTTAELCRETDRLIAAAMVEATG